jgi:hypothetical protein
VAQTRRDHLGLLAAGWLALWLPGASAGPRDDAAAPWAPLAGDPRTRRSAAALGRAYLRRHPEEASAAGLALALERRLPGGMPPERALRRACAEDFAAGDTLRLDGWVLARSECRLCALLALASR